MVHRVPNDINEAVKVRMQRQEMLYRPDKRFHFVITEASLRYRLVGRDIMIGQLDRLTAMTSMRDVKLGIIDFKTQGRPARGNLYRGKPLRSKGRG